MSVRTLSDRSRTPEVPMQRIVPLTGRSGQTTHAPQAASAFQGKEPLTGPRADTLVIETSVSQTTERVREIIRNSYAGDFGAVQFATEMRSASLETSGGALCYRIEAGPVTKSQTYLLFMNGLPADPSGLEVVANLMNENGSKFLCRLKPGASS